MRKVTFRSGIVIAILSLLSAPLPAVARRPIPEPATAMSSTLQTGFSLTARFDHSSQAGDYRTILNIACDLSLTTEQGQDKVVLIVGRGGEFGTVAWELAGPNNAGAGPLPASLTNADIGEPQFNSWIHNGQNSVNPDLPILLSQLPPPQQQPGRFQSRRWANATNVNARVFLRGCGETQRRRYADLFFQAGSLNLSTWLDERGDFQADISASGVQLDQDLDTWNVITSECDQSQIFPQTAAPGLSSMFTGTSIREAPDPDTLFGRLSLIRDRIGALVFQGLLTDEAGKHLTYYLDKAGADMREMEVDKSDHDLDKFAAAVGDLSDKGTLSQNEAALLIGRVQGLQTLVVQLNNPLPPDPVPTDFCEPAVPCVSQPCPAPTRFFVNGGLSIPNADGSEARPFRTIVEALARSEEIDACGVEVIAAPFGYAGDLVITRDTRIRGPAGLRGSIRNTGPHRLVVEDFDIGFSGGEGIVVDHPCARTVLFNVNIVEVTRYGIRQRGGSLLAVRSSVRRTRSTPVSLNHGSGMVLECGAHAALSQISLIGNESAGLLVTGEGTEVSAFRLTVEDNRPPDAFADPSFGEEGWAAILVRDRARLDARAFQVGDNFYGGVLADGGGQGLFEYGTVTGTLGIDHLFPSRAGTGGGINIWVRHSGHLQFFEFNSSYAELVGVQIVHEGSSVDLVNGEVSYNPIGVRLFVRGYDLARLTANVRYHHNETKLAALDLAPPMPAAP